MWPNVFWHLESGAVDRLPRGHFHPDLFHERRADAVSHGHICGSLRDLHKPQYVLWPMAGRRRCVDVLFGLLIENGVLHPRKAW